MCYAQMNNKINFFIFLCLFALYTKAETLSVDTLRTVALDEVVATGTRTAADARLLPVTVSVPRSASTPQVVHT